MDLTIDILHQVLGNHVNTYNLQVKYVDDADPWIGILAVDDFAVQSTYHRTKFKSPGHLVFGQYTILPFNNIADWIYIHQRKLAQTENIYYMQKLY